MIDNAEPGRAIVLAWPDATARGDEAWMMLLKKAGLVKNLNFKVGHAAVVFAESSSGALHYFDFGRYITARGMGRTRSALSDPKLQLRSIARFDKEFHITNLSEIIHELDAIKQYTHGKGRMFFSVSHLLKIEGVLNFSKQMVLRGSMPYGAIASGNSSCSRFVADAVAAGISNHALRRRIVYPESIMPSPISNVVNAKHNGLVYCFHDARIEELKMSRRGSLQFLIKQLSDNFRTAKSQHLPDDNIIGSISTPTKPQHLPDDAQWLGGIGEGAWYSLSHDEEARSCHITRYEEDGAHDFSFHAAIPDDFNVGAPYRFEYDSHWLFATISQPGKKFKLLNSSVK